MKTLLVYSSWHGTTELVAKKIADGLQSTDCTTVSLKKMPKIDLNDYERIILGSSIHAGNISGSMKKFIKVNILFFMQKELGLFICCMDPRREQEQFEYAYPEILRNHAKASAIMGGEFKMEKMNFFEKLIIKKVSGVTQSQSKINYKEIDKFIHTLNN